jgi:hypothetical protein
MDDARDVRHLSLARLAAALAIAVIGCAREAGTRTAEPTLDGRAALNVFADASFYRERSEPEETLRGTLRERAVREGPNTRVMPFTLSVGAEELGLYTSGFDTTALEPFVGRGVEVRGKRIDLRSEGYGVEVWAASIRLAAH